MNIHLPEYNAAMRADVYECAGANIFIGTMTHDTRSFTFYHATVEIRDGMMRDSRGYTLIVVPKEYVDQHADWMSDGPH